ncbi:thioredoxin domain-containing protein 9-like [Drosophila miranda]|uniref:thioredoxin domain-containing protein 9-like n=1 Tax=Drosophila miranda TaxID=7229 RepID=UPI0007E601AE|nr:thioredoxin domain-containing protein 9-like [Drosophila miranda]
MEKSLENQLVNAAKMVEQQLDEQLVRLDNLDSDDLNVLREQRLRELKELNSKKQEWLKNGHGVYTELAGEKEFFEVSKNSANFVCHFYRDSTVRCRIVDMHLKILAAKHVEAKFCKVNAEKSSYLTQRLRIMVIPTIALVKDSKTKDYIVGFSDLGNCDDFSTEILEWRIARSGVIEYNGDLMQPPDVKRKPRMSQPQKTIRGGNDSDDDDIDLDD